MSMRTRVRVTNSSSAPVDIAGRWLAPGGSDVFDLEQVPPPWRGGAEVVSVEDIRAGQLVVGPDGAGVRQRDGDVMGFVGYETNPLTGRIRESMGGRDLPSRSYRTNLLRGPIAAHPAPPAVLFQFATTITNPVQICPARMPGNTDIAVESDPSFRYLGGVQGTLYITPEGYARARFLTGGEPQAARWRTTVEFVHTGQKLEIAVRLLTTSISYRVWVTDPASGQVLPLAVAATVEAGTLGAQRRICLDFGSFGSRVVRFETEDFTFGGVYIEPTGSVQRTNTRRARFGVLSDSTGAGAGGIGMGASWPVIAAHHLDMDLFNLSIGGTGYVAGAGARSYADRLPDVIAAQLDYLFIAGGQNDKVPYSAAQVLSAADSLLAAVQRECPTTRILLGGIHQTTDNEDVTGIPIESGLRAIAATRGIPFISLRDPVGILDSTPPWATATAYVLGSLVSYIGLVWVCTAAHTSGSWDKTKWRPTSFLTGSGKVGATVGDGNADIYMLNETPATHYTATGHAAQGLWEAQQIIRAIN